MHEMLVPKSMVISIDMMYIKEFDHEFLKYDDDGNGIYRRVLPDGNQFDVVKNFPDESELRDNLKELGEDITYRKFESLKRWSLIYRVA